MTRPWAASFFGSDCLGMPRPQSIWIFVFLTAMERERIRYVFFVCHVAEETHVLSHIVENWSDRMDIDRNSRCRHRHISAYLYHGL